VTLRARWLVLAAALLAPATGHGVVPGGMAATHYVLPPAPANPPHLGYFTIESDLTVVVEPGLTDYFWAQQFSFVDGDSGYIGLQPNGYKKGQRVGKMAIVSIWGATAAGPDANCEPFDEFGTGWSCRLAYPWVEGETYRLRLTELCCAGDPAAAEWWRATLTPRSTGIPVLLGDLQVPGGWDWLGSVATVFKEYYWEVPTCAQVPAALVEWSAIAGNLGAATATPNPPFTYGVCAATPWVRCLGTSCWHGVVAFMDGFESGDTTAWSLSAGLGAVSPAERGDD
jgi:hypothetical protein